MNDTSGYAVFFFPQALEVLGDPIRPFLQDGPAGPHVACATIDTGGAFIEMTIEGRTPEGREVSLELMVPSGMVRMVVSTQSEAMFGFGLRDADPLPAALPVLGPTAEPASAPSEALPSSADGTPASAASPGN
ncbi:hypothetical protein [Lysobacter brunescens]|uniref:Uncharacterized protein n=1 Tax=Lysobacter brunescens TaxID=262323 RepID=A0ABW2YE78_9GAMM